MNVGCFIVSKPPFSATHCSAFLELQCIGTQFPPDESQKVKRLTGNLRHMEEMIKIGGVRVCKQEHHESSQIDALKEADSEKWSSVISYFPSSNAMPDISAS